MQNNYVRILNMKILIFKIGIRKSESKVKKHSNNMYLFTLNIWFLMKICIFVNNSIIIKNTKNLVFIPEYHVKSVRTLYTSFISTYLFLYEAAEKQLPNW